MKEPKAALVIHSKGQDKTVDLAGALELIRTLSAHAASLDEQAQNLSEIFGSVLRSIRERSELETTVSELRQRLKTQTPKSAAASLELLRRAYHAINTLHPSCKLTGCEVCGVKYAIAVTTGATLLMSSNQLTERK